MPDLDELFARNRQWAAAMCATEPRFFDRLARQQSPRYLWIGCSDSRVPATQITGLAPGEIFVHRNIANVMAHADLNCLSVLEFAVKRLRVEHVIVCGHYGCGGVKAAMGDRSFGLLDNWLRHIMDVRHQHAEELERLPDEDARIDRLCEENVRHQAANVRRTTVVQEAWRRGQRLSVHGWIYDLRDGLLKDLGVTVSAPSGVAPAYRVAGDAP
jgi:carbonic anhydrase